MLKDMSSVALKAWQTDASVSLGEVLKAHKRLGGTGPGKRALTEINYAYTMRLAAHFQGFARTLHSAAASAIVAGIPDPTLRLVMQQQLTVGRLLDKGNATGSNIGSDFGRFGFKFWDEVKARRKLNAGRKTRLDQLLEWRNGIAHDDLARRRAAGTLVPATMTLAAGTTWRQALDNLAVSFDEVVADQVENFGLPRPW